MRLAAAPAVVLLALVLAGSLAGCRRPGAEPQPPAPEPAPSPVLAVEPPAPRRAGRPPARPDREWLDAARAAMTHPVDDTCGPYRLLTDVEDPIPRRLCRRIGARLDEVYRSRFGLEPIGEPAGAILLFRRRQDFRSFAATMAGLDVGYAGFSRAARGVVALPVDEGLFAGTLAHELTHLVNRRALGPDLPPWLAEGLADAIGDAVGEGGLEELSGIRGIEGQARRLAEALAGGGGPTLEKLAVLRRGEFDRGVPSYDYELSAVAVRMFLTEPDLAPGFRRFLAGLAAGEGYAAGRLPVSMGVGWEELDRRLAGWLEGQLSPV